MGAAHDQLVEVLKRFEKHFSENGLLVVNVLDDGESIEYEINSFITSPDRYDDANANNLNSIEVTEDLDFEDVQAVVKYIMTQKDPEEKWFNFGPDAKADDPIFQDFHKTLCEINQFWVKYNGNLVPLPIAEIYALEMAANA